MSAYSSTNSHLRPDNRKTVFCLLENILKQSFIAAGIHLLYTLLLEEAFSLHLALYIQTKHDTHHDYYKVGISLKVHM